MRIAVKRILRDEKGAALVMVLLLLLVSGLITAPLLSYMGTGLLAGEVYEARTAELYAVDAGVEDAVWKIQQGVVKLFPGDPEWPTYNINVNEKNVGVKISSFYNDTISRFVHFTKITVIVNDNDVSFLSILIPFITLAIELRAMSKI